MTVRLHPATPDGDRLHRWAGRRAVGDDDRTAMTVCGITFAWGSWKGSRSALPKCSGCFDAE